MAPRRQLDITQNQLLYGDCIEMLAMLADESVDLIYLDPPFNSQQNYNMLFGSEMGEDTAQIKAFTDIWFWHSTEHEPVYDRLLLSRLEKWPDYISSRIQTFPPP